MLGSLSQEELNQWQDDRVDLRKKDCEDQPVDVIPVSGVKFLEVDGREKIEGESWESDDHGNQELVPDAKAILDPPQLVRQYRTTDR